MCIRDRDYYWCPKDGAVVDEMRGAVRASLEREYCFDLHREADRYRAGGIPLDFRSQSNHRYQFPSMFPLIVLRNLSANGTSLDSPVTASRPYHVWVRQVY